MCVCERLFVSSCLIDPSNLTNLCFVQKKPHPVYDRQLLLLFFFEMGFGGSNFSSNVVIFFSFGGLEKFQEYSSCFISLKGVGG